MTDARAMLAWFDNANVNGLLNLRDLLGIALELGIVSGLGAALAWLRRTWRRLPHFGHRSDRRRILKLLATIRDDGRRPRGLVAWITLRVAIVAWLGGIVTLYEGMSAGGVARALRHGATQDLLVTIGVLGLLKLIFGTALVLIPLEIADRVRGWADPDRRRRSLITRYLGWRARARRRLPRG